MPNLKNSKADSGQSDKLYEPANYLGVEKLVGYQFNDKQLLLRAVTHISYTNENNLGYARCYEKLEFLGDAVLQLIISDYLFRNNIEFREGKLTRFRSGLVSEDNLCRVSKNLGMGQFVLLSKGEHLNGGRDKASILADIFESLTGAIYLDSCAEHGIELVRSFVIKHLEDTIKSLDNLSNLQDSRSYLYEMASKKKWESIQFKCVAEEGMDHAKQYTYAVLINDIEYGRGLGPTKKKAARDAADNVLKIMGNNKEQN